MQQLASRILEVEIMDQPNLDVQAHRSALVGIGRVNQISGIHSLMWRALMNFRRPDEVHPLRVLDLGCGGGDVAIRLAQRAALEGVTIEVEGADISLTAIEFAQSQADALHLSNVRFFQADALHDAIEKKYDVVISSLFMHHLSDPQAVLLLKRMTALAGRGCLLDDLCRSRLGFLLAWCGVRLLCRSPIVHSDGPTSVRAAFRLEEVRRLAAEARLGAIHLQRHWPQRFLLSWKTDGGSRHF